MPVFDVWLTAQKTLLGGRSKLLDALKNSGFSSATIDAFLSGRRVPPEVSVPKIVEALAQKREENAAEAKAKASAEASAEAKAKASAEAKAKASAEASAEAKQLIVAMREEREQRNPHLPASPKRELPLFVAVRTTLWGKVTEAVKAPTIRAVCVYGAEGSGKGQFVEQVGLYFSSGISPDLSRRLFVVSLRNLVLPEQVKKTNEGYNSVLRRIAHELGLAETVGFNSVRQLLDFISQGNRAAIFVIRDVNETCDHAVAEFANALVSHKNDKSELVKLVIGSNQKLIIENGRQFPIEQLSVEQATEVAVDPALSTIDKANRRKISKIFEKIEPRTPIVVRIIGGRLWQDSPEVVEALLSPLPIVISKYNKDTNGQEIIFDRLFKAFDSVDQQHLLELSMFSWSFSTNDVVGVQKNLLSPATKDYKTIADTLWSFACLGWLDAVPSPASSNNDCGDARSQRFVMDDYLRDWLNKQLKSERKEEILDALSESVLQQINEFHQADPNNPFEQDWIRPLIPQLHDIQNCLDKANAWFAEIIENNKGPHLPPIESKRIQRYFKLMESLPLLWESAGWFARGATNLTTALSNLNNIAEIDSQYRDALHTRCKIIYQRQLAVLLYRGDQYNEAKKTIVNAIKQADGVDDRVLGQCIMVKAVIDLVQGRTQEAKKGFKHARVLLNPPNKEGNDRDLYFDWWALLWDGRCSFCLGNFDAAATVFRKCYSRVRSGSQSRAEMIALQWLARTYLFQAEQDHLNGSVGPQIPDSENKNLQDAKRCLIYAERITHRVADSCLKAHFEVLHGLYHRARSIEEPGRLEVGNNFFNSGMIEFTRLSDIYWLAIYYSIASVQSLRLNVGESLNPVEQQGVAEAKLQKNFHDSKAIAVDYLLKAVEHWDFLAQRQRPVAPPVIAKRWMQAVVKSLEEEQFSSLERIKSAGAARSLYLQYQEGEFGPDVPGDNLVNTYLNYSSLVEGWIDGIPFERPLKKTYPD